MHGFETNGMINEGGSQVISTLALRMQSLFLTKVTTSYENLQSQVASLYNPVDGKESHGAGGYIIEKATHSLASKARNAFGIDYSAMRPKTVFRKFLFHRIDIMAHKRSIGILILLAYCTTIIIAWLARRQ
jgi:hypothetical protein